MLTFREFLTEDDEARVDPAIFPLQTLYNQLNHQGFDGKLRSSIPVAFGKTPKGVAGVTYATFMGIRGQYHNYKTKQETIRIAINPVPYTLRALKGILAHEMCHAWNFQFDEHERDAHGLYFNAIRRKAETGIGVPISIKHTQDDGEKAAVVPKPCVFIAFENTSGSKAVALFNQSVTTKSVSTVMAQAMVDYYGPRSKWIVWGFGMTRLANTMPLQREITVKPKFYILKTMADIKVLKLYGHAGALPAEMYS